MTQEVAVCPRCGGPLPAGSDPLGEVVCPFCGAVSRRTGTTRELVKAAVREVLEEDANHNGIPDVLERRQPLRREERATPVALLVGLAVMLASLGVVAALVVVVARPHRSPPIVVRPPPPPRIPEPPKPPPPPLEPRGEAAALTFDEAGDLVAVLGGTVVKADPRTLELKWKSQLPSHLSNARLFPRGQRLALASSEGIYFLDAASGELVKKWAYGGILEGACASGKDEVMLNVLGAGTMFFDARTGSKIDWASHCQMLEPIGCPAGQRCRWSGQPCRYTLSAGKNVFRSCEVDDGQGTRELVASGGVKWKVKGEADTYFGVVGEVLIAATSGRVQALKVASGEQVWALAGRIGPGVVAGDGVLYLTVDGILKAVDLATGAQKERLHLP